MHSVTVPLLTPDAGAAARRTLPSPAAAIGAAPSTVATAAATPRAAGLPLRARGEGAQLNARLTTAQRAEDYVAELAQSLSTLKADVSRELTQRQADGSQSATSLARLRQLAQQRLERSGGSLSSSWRFLPEGEAQQRFTVAGLNRERLSRGQPETLVFHNAERGSQPVAVGVGGDLDDDELLRRLETALAPAGVRTTLGDDGALEFRCDESAWPALSSRLMLRGGGVRFPSGPAQRVRLEPQTDALQLPEWRTDSRHALRQTLQRIVHAEDTLRQAQAAISAAIAEARQALARQGGAGEAGWAQDFAADFNARFAPPQADKVDWSALYALTPALLGLSRYRVRSLLAL